MLRVQVVRGDLHSLETAAEAAKASDGVSVTTRLFMTSVVIEFWCKCRPDKPDCCRSSTWQSAATATL